MTSSSGKVVVGEEEEEEDQPVKITSQTKQQPTLSSSGKVVVGEEEEEEDQPVVSKNSDKVTQKSTVEVKQNVESSSTLQKTKEETIKLNEDTEKKRKGEEGEGMKYFAKFESDKFYYTSDILGVSSTLDSLKVKPKTLLEKKIVDQNEQIRKIWAIKLLQIYQQLNGDLIQLSADLNNSVNLTQDISHRQLEANDDLITLSTKLPHASSWLNSFISGIDINSLTESEAITASATVTTKQ